MPAAEPAPPPARGEPVRPREPGLPAAAVGQAAAASGVLLRYWQPVGILLIGVAVVIVLALDRPHIHERGGEPAPP